MEIVNLKNVTYTYPNADKPSLIDISMKMESGNLYALIGQNGGGKSTLCNLIKGFIPHIYYGDLEGKVEVFGKDMFKSGLEDFVSKVGYVSQNPFSQITGTTETVFEEIAYGLQNLGKEKEFIIKKTFDVIELFNLEDLSLKNPNNLSGGQKQIVAIASIYAMEPDLIILDEPTSQLDPESTQYIFEIISILKNEGKTILLVENKVELVSEYADKIFLMKDGKILDRGNDKEIFTKESTLEHGSSIPQYTQLAINLKKEGYKIDNIPTSEEECVQLVTNLLKGESYEFN